MFRLIQGLDPKGQVPKTMKTSHFCQKTLLIGNGRLSHHLQFYCQSLNWTVHRKFKSQQKSKRPLLYVWHRSQSLKTLQAALAECDQVWLAISDSAIHELIQKNLQTYGGKILHFSGALEVPQALSVHPMMTFSHKLYPKNFYSQITWVHTQKLNWKWHFPFFKNPHRQIPASEKIAYHLLCVLSGNFTQILLNTTSDLFSKLGLNPKEISPYTMQSVLNQQQAGWRGLTGPFVRRDQKTIQSHLEYLKSSKKSKVMTTSQKKQIQKLYLDFYSLYFKGKAL